MRGKIFGAYVRIDNQMTWPLSNCIEVSDLCDSLGYGKPTKEQLYHARSIIGAYQNLVNSTQKRRNAICKAMQEAK